MEKRLCVVWGPWEWPGKYINTEGGRKKENMTKIWYFLQGAVQKI